LLSYVFSAGFKQTQLSSIEELKVTTLDCGPKCVSFVALLYF
jgi:hypothetical protein